ncbi:hypothetical protein ABZ897_06725 [Nonomuraea sp. NPDC046802]|uniref:hypothetical protein n=1 Tax=Nonomuraea sp. NPDC046802 TaxID=3154919 RepID=UPI0033C06E34
MEGLNRLLSAARAHGAWRSGDAGCVVAEVFDQDLRTVVRTMMVAAAVCAQTSARLVALADPEWRGLAEAFGADVDGRPDVPPVALVTSRADGDVRREVPVVHVHGTGTLRAYALFPGEGPCSLNEDLPDRVGAFFERHVWQRRDLIRTSAERVAWRAKSDYQVRTDTERRQLRHYGCARLGLDADKPGIAVFAHVPGRDTELFEATRRFAAADESANWLFLDPVEPGPRIRQVTVERNLLWSMADVGVAFGDSELPAFGIPVIQAGWSESGACGATHVVRTPTEHRLLLEEALARHAKGESILGPEQRERARLWLWLRRCGADVPTALLPHWEHGDDYARTLAVTLRHAEYDGDPLFSAVSRMWRRREPLLTRFDFQDPAAFFTSARSTS